MTVWYMVWQGNILLLIGKLVWWLFVWCPFPMWPLSSGLFI